MQTLLFIMLLFGLFVLFFPIIFNYLFQCYIYINKINLAEKISKEMIYDNRLLKGNKSDLLFFEKLNSRLVKVKGFKISVLVDMIKMCIEKKKIKEMQK